MGRRRILDDLRVQELPRQGGWLSWTILWPDGSVHEEADRYLRRFEGSGSQRTYAYSLVDHLRWLEREGLTFESVSVHDLRRYMGAVGAEVPLPFGAPWRVGQKPYGGDALSTAASCLKAFYIELAAAGGNAELGQQLNQTRLPSRADRRRTLLGHAKTSMPSNPLAPTLPRRRHPKLPPEGARERLLKVMNTARDRMVITWLADGGFRIGELCGLHLPDLHLRENHPCREARASHAHICHRSGNLNHASAKTKYPWALEDGIIRGGLIKRVSPAMIHTYFDYMTSEYPRDGAGHGMLLVQLAGADHGQPWATDAARAMMARASRRAGLTTTHPNSGPSWTKPLSAAWSVTR